jgi:hypothetical protein
MLTCANHLLTYTCSALNCRRGAASTIVGLVAAGVAVVVLSGCCGPWWFCEDHHRHW